MGWSGAMIGLGEGMQNYSVMMRENQKMDRLSQMEAIKHQRNQNLEKIRASNQRQLATDKQQWTSEESQAQFDRNQGAKIAGYADGAPVTFAERDQRAEGSEALTTPDEYKRNNLIKDQEALLNARSKRESQVTDEARQTLHASEWYKKQSKVVRDMADLGLDVNGKFDMRLASAVPKGLNEPKDFHFKEAKEALIGSPEFDNASPRAKLLRQQLEAVRLANFGKEIGGSHRLTDKGLQQAVRDFYDDKVHATDLLTWSLDTQGAFLAALKDYEDPEKVINKTQNTLDTSTRGITREEAMAEAEGTGVLKGVVDREKPAKVPGRGAIQAVQGVFNPAKRDEDPIGERQRRSADIYR